MRLSIIVPCYNEELGISNLADQLNPVVEDLRKRYEVELVFVDDGSTDRTNELLHNYFIDKDNVKIVKHKKNMNLGAAMRTGFKNSSGDLIAALDSDCTYSPQLLKEMLEMMDEDTDIVTVSPYHPKGKVNNVPSYRIFLSKSVSSIYKILLGSNLHTYTAMVRIYRKDVVKNINFRSDTFLGITEIMIKSLTKGYRTKELPAELNVRKFGASKMKTLSVIKDHLGLISRITLHKIFRTEI